MAAKSARCLLAEKLRTEEGLSYSFDRAREEAARAGAEVAAQLPDDDGVVELTPISKNAC